MNWVDQEIPVHVPDYIEKEILAWKPSTSEKYKLQLKSIRSADDFRLKIFVMNVESKKMMDAQQKEKQDYIERMTKKGATLPKGYVQETTSGSPHAEEEKPKKKVSKTKKIKPKTEKEIESKIAKLEKKLNASELARSLVEEIGILSHFKESKEPDAKDRFDNVAELLTSIEEFSARNPKAELSTFLEDVSLQTDIDNWNDSDNRVTLMTVHSSKGLEFPVVFIAGMDEGLFPLFNSLDDKNELEEERRLFYVALTRAEEKVYLLYATNRRRMGAETVNGLPSRFINEIPEESLEKISFKRNIKSFDKNVKAS